MEAVRSLRKKYCPTAMFIAIIAALVMIFMGYRDLARGIVLGTLFSILNFVLMGASIQLRVQRTRRTGAMIAFVLVLLRFGFLALPLVVSIYYDKYHIVTTIAGLFMVQAVMLADAVKKLVSSRPA
ncbi:MAG: ATP synthase subunit I [Desulfosalsimonadaceae bacterium]